MLRNFSMFRTKQVILMMAVLLFGIAQTTWAQNQFGGSILDKINVNDAKITSKRHVTLTVKEQVVVDSLTMKVDTIRKVENVEYDTEHGTAKRRMAARQRRAASASGLYDKDTNWYWDMWWFTFNYPSLNGRGEPIVLSSLMSMPDEDCDHVNNLIIGCHSTITSNRECPSMNNHNGLFDTNDTDFFMLHSSSGKIGPALQRDMCYYNLVIIPDYEGYGVTKDLPHPYLSEELTARQVIDGVLYGLKLYNESSETSAVRHSFRDGWRSMSVGYSQGGGTSMAVHRFIEQNNLVDDLHFSGSICGSGPYNPVTTFMYYMHQHEAHGGTKDGMMTMAAVLPLILKGMCDSNPYMRNHKVSDYLEARFLETGILDWLDKKELSRNDISDEWDKMRKEGKDGDKDYYKGVLEEGGKAYLSHILKPEGYSYFRYLYNTGGSITNMADLPWELSIDPSMVGIDLFLDDRYSTIDPARPKKRGVMEDLHLALSYNDLTKGWNPQHPLYLYHSYGDKAVPVNNRISARKAYGEWIVPKNPALHLDHVPTAIEFLTGTEEPEAIKTLANAELHPSGPDSDKQGNAERIYKGALIVNGTQYDDMAEYVLRTDKTTNQTVAILGSGYNACASQYFLSQKVEVPETVTLNGKTYSVGGVNDMAFRFCTGITHVKLPEGVKRIGDFAFYGCLAMLELDLPSTLQTVGTGAFIDLKNLQSVKMAAETPPVWEYNDVFCFHKNGIGDEDSYSTRDVILWVPDDASEAYHYAKYTDKKLGWTTPDGWGTYFTYIRDLSDYVSESYASYKDGTLTFYHDGRRATRTDEKTFDLNQGEHNPGWNNPNGDFSPTTITQDPNPEYLADQITRVVFSPSFVFARPQSMSRWFRSFTKLETIEGWENLNTSEVTDMSFLFTDCGKLTSDDFDFSHFNTAKCKSFLYMFTNCTGITSLDLGSFDTSEAETLSCMFENCTNLAFVNLKSFNTEKVTDFSGMFYNCSKLEDLGIEGFHIGKDASISGLFSRCSSLKKVTLPDIHTNDDVGSMFKGLDNLTDLYYYGSRPFRAWSNRHNIFLPDQQTKFHVLASTLEAWKDAWPNDEREMEQFRVNATYVGDLGSYDQPIPIYTPANWDKLGSLVEEGLTGMYVKMMADVKVTSMVGSEAHRFSGDFDGNGHTLTFNHEQSENICAPFRYISGAYIKNLVVDGETKPKGSQRQLAGLVGHASGQNSIFNCVVKSTLRSGYSGDSSNGGFIAHIESGNTSIGGCSFEGKMLGSQASHCGGFVGWSFNTVPLSITDCVFAPAQFTCSSDISDNFARMQVGGTLTLKDCYYFTYIRGSQGKQAYSITSNTKGLTVDVPDGLSAPCSVSTIQHLGDKGGIKYKGVIYGGVDDEIKFKATCPVGYEINYLLALGAQNVNIPLDNPRVIMKAQHCTIMANLAIGTLKLLADGDNDANLRALDGKTINVQLYGREFFHGPTWQPLCLPFDLSKEQLADSPLAGAEIISLDSVGLDKGTLELNFSDTTAISADKVYLIRWTTSGHYILNPTFNNVTISRTLPAGSRFKISDTERVAIMGLYNKKTVTGEGGVVLLFNDDNTLRVQRVPSQPQATTAYIELLDIPYGLTILGDLNADGSVNQADLDKLTTIILNKGSKAGSPELGDLNEDGVVDIADVTKLVNILLGREYFSKGFNSIKTAEKVGITLKRNSQ